ncbi:hypothetical protein ZWY2020_016770 [Hordeum vulgare]|nr:hypothetical protein ZWY2020_016770 [Hordeum vulgare]
MTSMAYSSGLSCAGTAKPCERRAALKEEERIRGGGQARAGLVDGQHHRRASGGRHGAEAANDHERRGGVEAGGRLIEEEHAGVTEQGEANGHLPALASRS